jgi:hypothetical protein
MTDLTAKLLLLISVMILFPLLVTIAVEGVKTKPSARVPSGTCSTQGRSASPAERPLSQEARTVKYRVRDGSIDYAFEFVRIAGFWRIYIIEQPPYGGWSDGVAETHRHFDGDRPYVCWSISITTYEDAKEIAAAWAEATEVYRKTGTRF